MRRKKWRGRKVTLERIAYLVAIVGFPILLLSTLGVLYQLIEVRRIASSQNNIALTTLFVRDSNRAIIRAIENKKNILKEHDGDFDSTQLDNYLGDFETIDQVYSEGLLTEQELCTSFSYYVSLTAKNVEIQKYVADNSGYFGGFEDLAAAVAKSKDENCR